MSLCEDVCIEAQWAIRSTSHRRQKNVNAVRSGIFMTFHEPNAPSVQRRAPATSGDHEPVETATTSMTRQDACNFVSDYRKTLRAWLIAVHSSSPSEGDVLFRQMDMEQDQLAAIALAFPDLSYDVDALIKSRQSPFRSF